MPSRITVTAPVPGLLFWKLTGREALSEPFNFSVTLLSTDAEIDCASLLGQPLTVSIPLQNSLTVRQLNGKITRVAMGAKELGGNRYNTYTLTLESDLWPMQRDRNLRIFQEQTVPQIVNALLKEYQVRVEDKLSGSYRSWEYCVQYQESSFDFISRLMELEGISYHFRHEDGAHTLVLTDAPQQFTPFSGYEIIPYHQTPGGGIPHEEGIARWEQEARVTPGLYSIDDYDFRKPNAWLLQARQNPASPQPGNINVHDWPGRYVDHGHGEFYARIRQERWAVEHHELRAIATASGVCPGCTFTLVNAPRTKDNGEYLITGVDYLFKENHYASGGKPALHQLKFSALPVDVPFRPEAKTHWPRTCGPQTAKVVGPAGESIWTDRFGRVKLKFHWDREAKGDDTSSCWIRVSSAWAGQGYGGVQIPRVGDEVIVDFINGDPDRPIITGRVYNEASMPPWALPAAATQMGFMSRTKDGTVDNANALRFEDKAGAEQVFIQAERNMDTNVKNDESHSVGSNRTKSVMGNETSTIAQNRTETVNGNETITIAGNRTESVAGNETVSVTGNETLSISGERTESVAQNETVNITGNRTHSIKGNETVNVDQDRKAVIKGAESKQVKGNRKHAVSANDTLFVTGDKRDSVTGSRTTMIRSDDTMTVIGAQSKTVLGGDASFIFGSHLETVLGLSNTLVLGAQQDNVIGTRSAVVLGTENRSVTGSINDNASNKINIVVAESTGIAIESGKITLNAGGSTIVIDSSGVTVTGGKINLDS